VLLYAAVAFQFQCDAHLRARVCVCVCVRACVCVRLRLTFDLEFIDMYIALKSNYFPEYNKGIILQYKKKSYEYIKNLTLLVYYSLPSLIKK